MIKVIYEDNHLLVVEKPPNMPVQPDASHDSDMLGELKAYIKEKYNKPGEVYLGLVHRLDRPVGGVMVFARTSKAAARLTAAFKSKSAKKRYAAIVTGEPPKSGRLSDWLLRDEAKNTTRTVPEGTADAKPAELDFYRIAKKNGLTLADISLLTGRHHQIRVQLSSRGAALWGDQRYNPSAVPGQQIALWAYSLEIEHPTQKIPMRFISLPSGGAWAQFETELKGLMVGVKLAYADEEILIADKPYGLEVTDVTEEADDTLEARLLSGFSSVYPVHRIDATTTGLVLFARSEEAYQRLDAAMRDGRMKKYYRCTVKGRMAKESGSLLSYGVKDAERGYMQVFDSEVTGSKPMLLNYRTLSFDKKSGTSELEVELITGRTHQIRSQLAHVGCPIIGDDKYGDREFNRQLKCRRIRLRSYKLELTYGGKTLSVTADDTDGR